MSNIMTLTTSNRKQKSCMLSIIDTLERVYTFIYEQTLDEVIEDLSDIDHYFQKYIETDQQIPHKLVYSVARRAWGHAQTSNKINHWNARAIVLTREDFTLSDRKILNLKVLEGYPELVTKFKATSGKLDVSDKWIILKPFKYGFTLSLEHKQEVIKTKGRQWAWGIIEADTEGFGHRLAVWPKLHNSFVQRLRDVQEEFPKMNMAQIMSYFRIWWKRMPHYMVKWRKMFPIESYSHLIYLAHKRAKKGEMVKYLPKKIDNLIFISDNADRWEVNDPWHWMVSPLHGRVQYRTKSENKRYIVETVNRSYILKLTLVEVKDNKDSTDTRPAFIFGVKPVVVDMQESLYTTGLFS